MVGLLDISDHLLVIILSSVPQLHLYLSVQFVCKTLNRLCFYKTLWRNLNMTDVFSNWPQNVINHLPEHGIMNILRKVHIHVESLIYNNECMDLHILLTKQLLEFPNLKHVGFNVDQGVECGVGKNEILLLETCLKWCPTGVTVKYGNVVIGSDKEVNIIIDKKKWQIANTTTSMAGVERLLRKHQHVFCVKITTTKRCVLSEKAWKLMSQMKQMTQISLCNMSVKKVPLLGDLFCTLTDVTLHGCTDTHGVVELIKKLTNATRLSLFPINQDVLDAVALCHLVKHLTLGGRMDERCVNLEAVIKACPEVIYFRIKDVTLKTEGLLKEISEGWTRIETLLLEINICPNVEAVESLLTESKNLNILHVGSGWDTKDKKHRTDQQVIHFKPETDLTRIQAFLLQALPETGLYPTHTLEMFTKQDQINMITRLEIFHLVEIRVAYIKELSKTCPHLERLSLAEYDFSRKGIQVMRDRENRILSEFYQPNLHYLFISFRTPSWPLPGIKDLISKHPKLTQLQFGVVDKKQVKRKHDLGTLCFQYRPVQVAIKDDGQSAGSVYLKLHTVPKVEWRMMCGSLFEKSILRFTNDTIKYD